MPKQKKMPKFIGYIDVEDLPPGFFEEKQEEKNELVPSKKRWELFNKRILSGVMRVKDQIANLFASNPDLEKTFLTSKNPIVQFGMGTGDYFINKKIPSYRTVIGDDISSVAVAHLNKHNISGRLIDLNSRDTTNHLDYQAVLQADLSSSAHVFFINVLQYLEPPTVKLLAFAMLDLVKPGTLLYFFTHNTYTDKKIPCNNEIQRYIPAGYIPSFFAPREDIEFLKYRRDFIENDPSALGNSLENELLIIKKLG